MSKKVSTDGGQQGRQQSRLSEFVDNLSFAKEKLVREKAQDKWPSDTLPVCVFFNISSSTR